MRTRDLGRLWPVIVALVIVGGTALAQIPDADGVIHGCYARNGALRVIDAPSRTCKRGETAISWNQEGQPGEQGLPGEPGTPGTPGEDGTDGTSVVARLRWTGNVTLGDTSPLEFSLGPWEQGATDLNEIIPGTITLTAGPRTGSECGFANLRVQVRVPGWGDAQPPHQPGHESVVYNLPSFETDVEATRTTPILLHGLNNAGPQPYPIVLFEPGVDTTRELEVLIHFTSSDACAHLTAFSFDVVAIR